MRFSQKLEILMAREALSNLALAKELGDVAHTTVARWLAGSLPRGAIARKLADRFKIPVEVLLDDRRALPFEFVHEQAAAHDESDATVIKGPIDAIAKPAGVAGKLDVGWARAVAQQLRDMADKIDPDHAAAVKELERLKAEVDQAAAAPPAKSRRPAS